MKNSISFLNPLRRQAFTMIEMLAVILIVAILAGSATFYIADTMSALRMTMTGEQLLSIFSSAQQTASSEGRVVELRFVKYQDASKPGSLPLFRSVVLLRHYQAGESSPDPADQGAPLTAPLSIVSGDRVDAASGIVFSQDRSMSSLLAGSGASSGGGNAGMVKVKGSDGQFREWTFPHRIAESVSVYIRPDGTTNLDPSQRWFVTALYERSEEASDKASVKNFYCVQIDPANSRIVSYRP
jgi:uncharacterized protein (TIGR02596 family)